MDEFDEAFSSKRIKRAEKIATVIYVLLLILALAGILIYEV